MAGFRNWIQELDDWIQELASGTGATGFRNWLDWIQELEDWIQELAGIFAPRSSGMIEAVRLAGSFNPLIANRLAVGKG